jgi:hypothetical protein
MKWSKLKESIESKFADTVRGRVCIYSTRYTTGSHFMARGWITVDGKEVANFSTPDHHNKYGLFAPDIDSRVKDEERTKGEAIEKGEFSRYDFMYACWDYLNMNIDNALTSENPIIKAFAMLDSRLGKRRLMSIDSTTLHPLVRRMLDLRLDCEKLTKPKSVNVSK